MATNIRIKYDVNKKEVRESEKELRKLDKTTDVTRKDVSALNKKFDKQQRELTQSSKGFKKLRGAIAPIGGLIASAFAVSALKNFAKEVIRLSDIQAKAEAKLLTALKGREDIQRRLMAQARALQKITLFGDEVTIEAQAFLAAMGLSESAVKRLIPLVQDLATKMGGNLVSAADLIAKSVGSSTNALSRYGIVIEGSVGSSERLESAIFGLNQQVGGQAVAAAKAGAGAFTILGNSIDDVKEGIGEMLIESLNPMILALNELITRTPEAKLQILNERLTELLQPGAFPLFGKLGRAAEIAQVREEISQLVIAMQTLRNAQFVGATGPLPFTIEPPPGLKPEEEDEPLVDRIISEEDIENLVNRRGELEQVTDALIEDMDVLAAEKDRILERDRVREQAKRDIMFETLDIEREIAGLSGQLLDESLNSAIIISERGSALQLALLVFEKLIAISRIITSAQEEIAVSSAKIAAALPPGADVIAIAARTAAITARASLGIAIIGAQSVPEFAGSFHEGGEIKGPFRHGDVPIIAQEGEWMMKTKAVDYYGTQTMKAINNMEIKPMVGFSDDNIVEAIDKMNNTFANRPVSHNVWNERGFSHYMVKGNNRTNYLNRRYV